MEFPRQEYWSRLPLPSPGDLLNPGIEPTSPPLQANSLLLSYQGNPFQAPLSMGFPRQEYWSGCHFLLQGIFPTQGSNLRLLLWWADSLLLSHLGSLKPITLPTFVLF